MQSRVLSGLPHFPRYLDVRRKSRADSMPGLSTNLMKKMNLWKPQTPFFPEPGRKAVHLAEEEVRSPQTQEVDYTRENQPLITEIRIFTTNRISNKPGQEQLGGPPLASKLSDST